MLISPESCPFDPNSSSLFALSKPNNPRPVPSLMALSSDYSSLLFLSRSVAVQVQEHQKRFCRRPLDGKNTERHVGRPSPPLQQPEALGLPTPPARAGGRPPSPPPLWVVGFVWGSGLPGVWVVWGSGGRPPSPPPSGLRGGLGCLGFGIGIGSDLGRGTRGG